ncbi:MAG: glycoside hydrolase family 88 protein, partial [Bacteroidales bacterium]|nr:glycoside hydrolase family 88 protein [Bacteroidales bacterium]
MTRGKQYFAALSILVFSCLSAYSQSGNVPAFSNSTDRENVMKVLQAVADWQMANPSKHHPADWTNAALYAGMADYASIAQSDKYFEWLKSTGEKLDWNYYVHEN